MHKRILVLIDGSPASSRSLDEAIDIARTTRGLLRLVHMVDDLSLGRRSTDKDTWLGTLSNWGREILEAARKAAEARGVLADVRLYSDFATPLADAVAYEARMWPADLIVLSTPGRRGRWAMGSDAERFLRTSTVPMMLVPELDEAAADKRSSTRQQAALAPALAFE